MTKARPVIVIAGPTASGKSWLAASLAQRIGGVVINADSLQLYDALPILTARPGPELTSLAAHALYGILDPRAISTAAAWADMARAEIERAHDAGLMPIVVGGTGLYLEALMHGMAHIPAVPHEVRTLAREEMAAIGNEAFRLRLIAADPDSAGLKTGDTQRLLRAWEVITATGRSLTAWQQDQAAGPSDYAFHAIVILPPRETVREACDRGFVEMVTNGVIDEVAGFLRDYDAEAAAARAVGFAPLASLSAGRIGQEEAIAQGQAQTRQYAKRQSTWFRNRFIKLTPDAIKITDVNSNSLSDIESRLPGLNHG